MPILKVARNRIWRRLEPRITALVDRRLAPVVARLETVSQTAEDARRQAAAALQAIEGHAHAGARREELAEITAALRTTTATAGEARRLATESARAIEQLLQAEVTLWQAVDARSQ